MPLRCESCGRNQQLNCSTTSYLGLRFAKSDEVLKVKHDIRIVRGLTNGQEPVPPRGGRVSELRSTAAIGQRL